MEEDQLKELSGTPSEPKKSSSSVSSKRLFMIVAIFMIVTVVAILVLTIIITVILAVENKRCSATSCRDDLLQIYDQLDETIQPCDDFYRFACGNFGKNHDQSSFSDLMFDKLTSDLNDIVTAPISDKDPVSLTMQKSYYQSCMEVEEHEEGRDRELYQILYRLGGWPLINGSSWDEGSFHWAKTISLLAEMGLSFDFFLDVNVEEDEDTNTYILYLGYPLKYMELTREEGWSQYSRLMEDIAIYMGAPTESVQFEVERMVHFQTELLRISKEAHEDEQFNIEGVKKYRLIDVQNHLPDVRILDFIKNVTGRHFRYDEEIKVNSMEYIRNLYQLLLRTPKRFQADLIIMKLIDELWPYLSNYFLERYDTYKRDVEEVYHPLNRTKSCLEVAHVSFIGVADAVYVRRVADAKTKREVKELISNVKYKFANHLKKATWLDSEAKQYALSNISEILEYVAGPDYIFEESKYEEKLGYTGFGEQDMNMIQKMMEYNKQTARKKFQRIGTQYEDFDAVPEYVIGQYEYFRNEDYETKVVPANLLQDDFYDPRKPNYANYGTLGALLSQKITHIFGKRVNAYLKDSKRLQWWTSAFDVSSATNCYTGDDMGDYYRVLTANGTLRVEKNFADYIATDIAYEVYHQWVKQHGAESSHPKVTYTPNQLFWMYSMQPRCVSEIDAAYNEERDKWNNLVKNSLYFANIFKCIPGSNMNPDDKCQIL